jgi:hypothetical protein
MNRAGKLLCLALCAAPGAAVAEDSPWSVVPGLDFGYKRTNFVFSVQGVGESNHRYSTLAPSLAVGYGSVYSVLTYDYTINGSRVTEAGSAANPVFTSREYERDEGTLTFGYRLTRTVNVFLGLLRGESDFYSTSYDTSNPANPTTTVSSFVFRETGYYLGLSKSLQFTDKNSLGLNAAYGRMDGQLDLKEASGKTVFYSSAPGYSLGLIWTRHVGNDLAFRAGVKYTRYIFDIDRVTTSGSSTAQWSPGSLYFEEKITSFFVGLAGYF